MDGLLLDSERSMYLKLGLEVSSSLNRPVTEEFLKTLMGGNWDNYFRRLTEVYGEDYPVEEYKKLLSEKIDYMTENVAFELRPGVEEVLKFNKENNIKMAVASSTPRARVIKSLTNAGIVDYFDHVIGGDQVKKGKPDPEIFLKAIDEIGANKSEALILEDGHNGAKAAIDGGCRLILVEDLAYVEQSDRDGAELVTHIISDVIELIRKENERTTGV